MLRNSQVLGKMLEKRMAAAGPRFQAEVQHASEIIIFGSMSVGYDRSNSDLDVLCVAGSEYCKFKNKSLDLIVVPSGITRNRSWLESELATHVAAYGSWIKGAPTWIVDPRIGQNAIRDKRRRVSAFMRCLYTSWARLEACFQIKYATKLRRETQRLMLLERNVPVPPTAVLDDSWASPTGSHHDVSERLRRFSPVCPSSFVDCLLSRVDFQVSDDQMHSNSHYNS
jgi:hypothetical protein